jgi:hypothetical protein
VDAADVARFRSSMDEALRGVVIGGRSVRTGTYLGGGIGPPSVRESAHDLDCLVVGSIDEDVDFV